MNNAIESTGNRTDHTEERTSAPEDGTPGMIQVEEETESVSLKNEEVLREFSNSFRKGNIRTASIPEGEKRERRGESPLKK